MTLLTAFRLSWQSHPKKVAGWIPRIFRAPSSHRADRHAVQPPRGAPTRRADAGGRARHVGRLGRRAVRMRCGGGSTSGRMSRSRALATRQDVRDATTSVPASRLQTTRRLVGHASRRRCSGCRRRCGRRRRGRRRGRWRRRALRTRLPPHFMVSQGQVSVTADSTCR